MEQKKQPCSDDILLLEQKFSEIRSEYCNRIAEMSERVKRVESLVDLQTDVLTERQRVVEYYHYIQTILIKVNKEYRNEYANLYDYYTNKSQIRYPNETSKNNKITADLGYITHKRDTIENHLRYLSDTKNTIDNLIWSIKNRIRLYEIMNHVN